MIILKITWYADGDKSDVEDATETSFETNKLSFMCKRNFVKTLLTLFQRFYIQQNIHYVCAVVK
jgi:hypothetical protein